MKAVIEPAITSPISSCDIVGDINIPTAEAANIVGTDSKKENFATDCLLAPDHKPVTIVSPLRDIPGKIDTPCAKPIKRADFQLISHSYTCNRAVLIHRADTKTNEVIINILPLNIDVRSTCITPTCNRKYPMAAVAKNASNIFRQYKRAALSLLIPNKRFQIVFRK